MNTNKDIYIQSLIETLNREIGENRHSLEELMDAYWQDRQDIILQTLSADCRWNRVYRQFM